MKQQYNKLLDCVIYGKKNFWSCHCYNVTVRIIVERERERERN